MSSFSKISRFFITDEEDILCMEENEILPIEERTLRKVEGLEICDDDFRVRFFNDITEMRIKMINGAPTNPEQGDSIYCDYCDHSVRPEGLDYKTPFAYYRCGGSCNLDMCELCFTETSEEIAISNGAKNYAKRAEKLQRCQKHLHLRRIEIPNRSNIEKLSRKELEKYWENMDYGSIRDWLPIYRIEEEGMDLLCVNRNERSPYFNRVSLCGSDDHGRCGIFVIPDVSYDNLDEILTKLEFYHLNPPKNEDGNDLEGWDRYENLPIKRLMSDYNMQIHFG